MSKEELLEKIKAEGGYQTVEINGEVLHKGWRECEKRWELIKGAVGEGKAVIDFGSHYGYFSRKIAQAGNIVWSIEGGAARAEIQREMLEQNAEPNVYLCERQMAFRDWFGVFRTCEGVDTILALSVLHYIEPKELFDTLWLFSNIAPNLIVEFPPQTEKGSAAYENVEAFGDFVAKLKCFYEEVVPLGEAPSPSNTDTKRIIYHASNHKLFKANVGGYLSYDVFGRKHRVTYFNGRWSLDEHDHEWVAGFNARTFFKMGLVYPNADVLLENIANVYIQAFHENNFNVTDVSARNALLTLNGLKLIDLTERAGEDVYGMPWEEYKSRLMELTRTDIVELLKLRK